MVFKKILTGAITAAALDAATLAMSGEASAHPRHHGHHWRGGPFFVFGDVGYVRDCYMVKRFTRSGRPYLVEVCS